MPLARAELEARRLLADVIKPAEAAQRRALLEARVAGTWQLLEGAAATLGIDLKGLENSLNQTRQVGDGE